MTQAERILIIEDEAFLRAHLRAVLGSLGYEVLEARSGEEGLEACARLHPDLVLLDVLLPRMDGFEVCTRLKADEALREIPVVFLSGLMETQEKIRAFEAGAVDYLIKPCQIVEVEARLRVHLEIRRQRHALHESREQAAAALAGAEVMNRKLLEINERLARSESLKSHFVAHMRNELNNPLAAIMGLADQVIRTCAHCSPMATRIRAEAFHLDFQLRNVFFAADLEDGQLEPAFAMVDLPSILGDVTDSFAHLSAEKELTVQLSREPLRFPSDAAFLNVIVANLLANAIEFSPRRGLVEVQATLRDDGLTLAVRDRGPGIAEADHAAIFERFRQLESGLTRNHLGQGLGLSVTRALVELLGGEIRVESRPGEGAEFILWLPPPASMDDLDTSAFDGNFFLFGEAGEP